MPPSKQNHLTEQPLLATESLTLSVTGHIADGFYQFEWFKGETLHARGVLAPGVGGLLGLSWAVAERGRLSKDSCSAHGSSTRALLNRIQKLYPVPDEQVRVGFLSAMALGPLQPNVWHPLTPPAGIPKWSWMMNQIKYWVRVLESPALRGIKAHERGRVSLHFLASNYLDIPPAPLPAIKPFLKLRVNLDRWKGKTEFVWTAPGTATTAASVVISPAGKQRLGWVLSESGNRESGFVPHARQGMADLLAAWLERFPTELNSFQAFWVQYPAGMARPHYDPEAPFGPGDPPFPWLLDNLEEMDRALKFGAPPELRGRAAATGVAAIEQFERKLMRKEHKRAEEEARRQETMARLTRERTQREKARAAEKTVRTAEPKVSAAATPSRPAEPLPPVPVRVELPTLQFQDTTFPISNLKDYRLRERAALLWVSNQSDDLLCLPHCRIERLEYQLRTALRVLGPLRGRALLSDEVGLGKTIEAGLIIKELLTRGMVKRFLVLTVPSLVDQWQEELNEKFGLQSTTTNEDLCSRNPAEFWNSGAVVASLHTLKQPAHLEIARHLRWDILVVDEAHYLRNRDSQAWQAVNSLTRQFLLLLTATPVQNSLEELYNLVTLLQPGQLPTPREFRARFIDSKRPRQPREPEELRRLLGQVMIRNTRANSGLHLPPRHAETVLFEPGAAEAAFWNQWETEFRASLSELPGGLSSLWGRLLLQAAGSSPAAWRAALLKFPDARKAQAWRGQSPLLESWQNKCRLIPALTHAEGGVVIFTQFLETQAALAEFLREMRIETFVINGSTPAAERHPITEEFRQRAGALLLTHSGTEGRNLQFSHRLINFDLPWNPMELEQRIGRLHRLGQRHPVRIYNFVQAGTLQEHLLQILQEKLNLFELVVGETGLVLGDRFSSDEFAEEVLRRWRESEGRVGEAMAGLGEELAAARGAYSEVKQLDETLFAKDYESV